MVAAGRFVAITMVSVHCCPLPFTERRELREVSNCAFYCLIKSCNFFCSFTLEVFPKLLKNIYLDHLLPLHFSLSPPFRNPVLCRLPVNCSYLKGTKTINPPKNVKRGLFESFLTVGEIITSLDVDNEQNHVSHARVLLRIFLFLLYLVG